MTALLMAGAGVLIPASGCGKERKTKPKAEPLIILSLRISFPDRSPDFAKPCKGTYFRYRFEIAHAKYTEEDSGQLHDSVRLDLSLTDNLGKKNWGLTLKPPSPFRPALKTSKLRWIAAACTDRPLRSGTHTFQINAVDEKGGGQGRGERTVTFKGSSRSPAGGKAALLPGHRRLANTRLQLRLPPGAQVKQAEMSGDEISLKKHGALVVRRALVPLTLDKVLAQLSRLPNMKIHGYLMKKGPGPGWTFALTYSSSWKHDPQPKLRFHQGFTRRGNMFSCTGNPGSNAAALAFHRLCAAIR